MTLVVRLKKCKRGHTRERGQGGGVAGRVLTDPLNLLSLQPQIGRKFITI